MLSLQQVRVEGECFYCFYFFIVIHFPLSPLSCSFISFTTSSTSLLPFSGRRHKMIHKGWHVVKPQRNLSLFYNVGERWWLGPAVLAGWEWSILVFLLSFTFSVDPPSSVSLFLFFTSHSAPFLPFSGRWQKLTKNGSCAIKQELKQTLSCPLFWLPNYHIQPNYRTYPFKRTLKQICSLQITTRL